ncbi:MAG: ATP-dependent DNA helicase RecQ [Rhodospirillales bacterium]|nr:ATP-dependent DNA helicase RecQ [Rhodospirillales bacterium]
MLEGSVAFQSLAQSLRDDDGFETEFSDPEFERLRLAIRANDASGPDLAVLMRHALRYESLRRSASVVFETDRVDPAVLEAAGLQVKTGGTQVSITAKPWAPSWLEDAKVVPVDEASMRAERKRFHPGSGVLGDPFLAQFGLQRYRSAGQRAAVRAALSMPSGSMLIVDLPTGEGKSLVFRSIQKIGFSSDLPGNQTALTIVIVPTVTLALDHERSCGGSSEAPMAYVGNEPERNAKIVEGIRSGQQELVFAAPEAVVGPLRFSIGKALERDGVRAVVVDEAHLIEGWGTGFRTEFQTFAGLCHQWRGGPETTRSFRVLFLSATLSAIARDTIQELFSPNEKIETVSAASIRPEPEFWIADFTDIEERRRRVLEAVYHLPRPAILYVTKVEDAEYWYHHLRYLEGFQRIKKVHGGTGSGERENVLAGWAAGSVDLVVATSAFGLGIDYPHVRSVIHACVPEKLDRFYQEVGRGGRDGCSSISLLIPEFNDLEVAESLSKQKIISVDRGFQRWKAMFESSSRIDLGNLTYGVRLDTAPSKAPEDIDLIGERSIDWNARVLSMMARSGLVQLSGFPEIETEPGEEIHPYQGVRICHDGHLVKAVWKEVFEGRRQEIALANATAFQTLRKFITKDSCACKLIASLYPGCKRACTECPRCRVDPGERYPSQIVGEPSLPWAYAPNLSEATKQVLGAARCVVVEYGPDLPKGIRARDMQTIFKRLDKEGFRIAILLGTLPDWLQSSLEKAVAGRPWLRVFDKLWNPIPWPKGNSLTFTGSDVALRGGQLNARGDFPEIIFIPEGARDADIPDRRISDITRFERLDFAVFCKRYLK